jgi:hypothetical protein
MWIVGCEENTKAPLPYSGPDEGDNKLKISRFFQSNPMINEVQIRTPLDDLSEGNMVKRVIVYKRNIGDDHEYFEITLNGRNDIKLNDVNKGRIEINFEGGKTFSYSSKSSSLISSMVFDDGVKILDEIGTIRGVLIGSKNRNAKLIDCLQHKRVLSFTLEGFNTVVSAPEAELFRKDVMTVMSMK